MFRTDAFQTCFLLTQRKLVATRRNPREYDLLVLLASHPGWVFKREVLLQQVWGDSYEGFDRTIDNHITRLRKKLGPLGEKIDTVWSVGYRFIE
jgi:DNA-binding response OmpR family regulator